MRCHDGVHEKIIAEYQNELNFKEKKVYEYPGGNWVDGLPPVLSFSPPERLVPCLSFCVFVASGVGWFLRSLFLGSFFLCSLSLSFLIFAMLYCLCVISLSFQFVLCARWFRDVLVLDKANFHQVGKRLSITIFRLTLSRYNAKI